jgi:hypothetical protein
MCHPYSLDTEAPPSKSSTVRDWAPCKYTVATSDESYGSGTGSAQLPKSHSTRLGGYGIRLSHL